MAMTFTELTHDQKANPGTGNFTTASISPSSTKLYIVLIASWLNSGTVNTPTLSGDAFTWNQIITHATNTNLRWTAFYGAGSSTSGALTIDHGGQTVIACSWSVLEITGADTSGNPIVQSTGTGDNGTNTGITITLGAFVKSTNVALGTVLLQSGAAVTKGTNFTQISNFGSGIQTVVPEYAVNQTSVNWTWSSDSSFKDAIAMEIKASKILGIDYWDVNAGNGIYIK